MRTPEENWQRSKGVIAGPGVGMLVAIPVTLFAGGNWPLGYVMAGAMGAGLIGGAVYDLARRIRHTTSRCQHDMRPQSTIHLTDSGPITKHQCPRADA